MCPQSARKADLTQATCRDKPYRREAAHGRSMALPSSSATKSLLDEQLNQLIDRVLVFTDLARKAPVLLVWEADV